MYVVGRIEACEEELVLDAILSKPGFVLMKNCSATYNCLHPILRRDKESLCHWFNTGDRSQRYVTTEPIRKEVKKIFEYADSHGLVKIIGGALVGVDGSKLHMQCTEEIAGLDLFLEGVPLVSYSSDTVLSVKLGKWPAFARSLPAPGSQWPDSDLVEQEVAKGCHLVPKCSPTGTVTAID